MQEETNTQQLIIRDNYRRLRILYNRIMLFGQHPYYIYWAAHEFQTNLGPRTFVCTTICPNTEEEYLEFYYLKEQQPLFIMKCNKQFFEFRGRDREIIMTEQEAWLAIYELEELSYQELEKIPVRN